MIITLIIIFIAIFLFEIVDILYLSYGIDKWFKYGLRCVIFFVDKVIIYRIYLSKGG